MAPRNTRTGATTATKRTPAKGSSRSSSSSRSRDSSASRGGAKRQSSASRSSAAKRPKQTGTRGADPKARGVSQAEARRWWALPVAVVVLLAAFAWSYYPVARVQYRETREKARLEAELSALQARNSRLRAEVARLRTPEGVEDYARSQLGLVKRGESVAMVVDGNEAAKASAALAVPQIDGDEAVEGPVGPWTAFLDIVFGVQ